MLAFALVCTISWFVTHPDAENAKLRWLNTIFQLACFPFLTYYIASNSRYSDARPQTTVERCDDYSKLPGLYRICRSITRYRGWFGLSTSSMPPLSDQGERLTGSFCNSSMLGAALVMNFGCLCVMTLYTTGGKRRYLYALMLLSCACIYFTSTRTVWLGFFVMLVIFYFSRTSVFENRFV